MDKVKLVEDEINRKLKCLDAATCFIDDFSRGEKEALEDILKFIKNIK